MAQGNVLELVVEVSTNAANAALKSINDGLDAFTAHAVEASTKLAFGFQKFEQEAARITKQFASQAKEFIQDPLKTSGEWVEKLILKMGPLGGAIAGLAGAFGALFAVGGQMAHQLGEAATQLYNTSVRMGTTINETKQLSIAAKMGGGDIADFERAMRMLSQGMSENSTKGKEARQQLADWGITGRGTVDVLTQISAKLAAISDPWERNAAAVKVLGRSGLELLPILVDMGKNMQAVKDSGLGMTDQTNKWARELHEQATLADAKLEKIKNQYFAKPLANIWSITVDFITRNAGPVRDLLRSLEWAEGGFGAERAKQMRAEDAEADWKARKDKETADFVGGLRKLGYKIGPGINSPRDDASAEARAKIESGLENEIVKLYVQRLDAGRQIIAQGAERIAQLRAEGELTEKATRLINLQTKMKWQDYTAKQRGAVPYDTSLDVNSVLETSGMTVAETVAAPDVSGNVSAAQKFGMSAAKEQASARIAAARQGGGSPLEIAAKIRDIEMDRLAREKELGKSNLDLELERYKIASEFDDARLKAIHDQEEAQQHAIDKMKEGFNQVFDSLMAGGKGLMQTLMNLFRAAAITPIRNAFSQGFASLMAPMLGGVPGAAMIGTPGAGGFTGFGAGVFSSMLAAGATAGRAGLGWGAGGDTTIRGLGMGNGLGIGGWGGLGGGGQAGSVASGLGGVRQLTGLAGMKQSLSGLGNIGIGKGTDAAGNATGGWFNDAGTGGALGGAMLAGGGMLMMDGLRRGGGIGMLEDIGGGAAIGGKFGGVLGAGIGAAAGALVGGLRWLFGKNPEQEMKNAVKDAYGVKIDSQFAQSLVKEAGGIDFRVFVQQQRVRDEIMLYARMTESKGGNSSLYRDTSAHGVNMTEVGGSLYQSATYFNGGAYGYQSTLASLGSFQTLSPNTVSIALDGRATTAALGGAVVSTTSQSQGRTGLAANIMSPSTVLV